MTPELPVFEHAHIERDARGVYTLTIVDAKSLNILGTPVLEGLTRALHWIADQTDARTLVLRGGGDKAFVAGADIHEMHTLDATSAPVFITRVRALCDVVRDLPVPTIARIPGYCLGAGLELAAACDIRLATTDAVFGMPEVRVGLPSVVQAALLPALIGQGATNWLLLTGENIDAAQARAWHLVEFLCEPGQLDALVERSVAAIVASGPRAVRSQKSLLRYWQQADLEAGMDRSVEHFADAFSDDEPQRYMAPFTRRRS
ncbi:enoyl-CoA hydratase [Salinisphaera aquimarina]|uniref:Enoyl-CoA hydratase n=1 Tax=Salinisphaera aquimarina TaxID=2094031 RepID=A0ABV7ENV2_9GAMM